MGPSLSSSYVGADLHDEVLADPDNVLVEGGVMQLAEREAVRDGRFPERVDVRNDVRRVEELLVGAGDRGRSVPGRHAAHAYGRRAGEGVVGSSR